MKIEIPEGYEARINGNEVVLEPKENEDERIRKEIIDYLNFAESHNLLRVADYKKKKGWLAYLERHKEQKPTAEEVLIRAGLKPFKDGNQWCVLVGDNIQEGICGFGDTIEDAFYEFLKEVGEQQKPVEWSEKDEAEFGDLMWCIEQARRFAKDENDMGNIWFAENWVKKHIKSLRPQPKAKWSKEDEKMLSIAIHMVRNSKTLIDSGVAIFEVSDFLKSIKDKAQSTSHWKPSEEQIKRLEDIITMRKCDEHERNVLNTLLIDLKKLCP